MTKIALIGAGLSGLTAATLLKDHAEITLFEKSRGVGGRMATRRADPYAFDHGASFFHPKTDAFKKFLAPLIAEDVVQPWEARFVEIENRHIKSQQLWTAAHPHYVGVPGMNAVGKYLGQSLTVKTGLHVHALAKTGDGWSLQDEQGHVLGAYDWVLCALPAEQATALLPPSLPLSADVKAVKMQGCFTVMLGFSQALPLPFEAALIHGEDVARVSVESSKPGRSDPFCLLLHANSAWADAHMEDDRAQILTHLCAEASAILGQDLSKADHQALHRWRYASLEKQEGAPYFIDAAAKIGVCGDWFLQGRVEAAFTSGMHLAHDLLEKLRHG